MKLHLRATLLILFVSLTFIFRSEAQVYNITTNTSWTAAGIPNCNTCTFNISPGVIFTLDKSSATCTNCAFNGGTVSITAKYTFSTSVSFTQDTLLVNYNPTVLTNPTLTSDSIAVNQPTSFVNANITGSRIQYSATNVCQACTFTNDTMSMNNAAMTLSSGASIFGTKFNVTGSGTVTATSNLNLAGSTMTMSGTGYLFENGGSAQLDSSQLFLNGNTYFQANSGPIIVENHSEIFAGDGSAASTAHITITTNGANNGLQVYDYSVVGMANGNNYYANGKGFQYTDKLGHKNSVNTSSNTISCGSGHAHACTANVVYGCATMNFAGAASCSVLAIAESDFAAAPTGLGKVATSWSEPSNADLAYFKVERSSDGKAWNKIAAFDAGMYATGEYHFNDGSAPAGLVYYRLQMTDKDGRITWSKVVTVTVEAGETGSNTGPGIFPNPSADRRFYVRTGSTDETVMNIFTLSGQLLLSSRLKGQMQYPVELPQSVETGSLIAIQLISGGKTRAFTLSVR